MKSIFRIDLWEGVFNDIVAASILLVMMMLVVSNVVGRYVLNIPIQGTIEITEFLMVGIVFLTLSCAQAKRNHIRVEIFYMRFPRKIQLWLDLLAYLLGFIIIALITWQGWLSFWDSLKFREATDGYIAFPVYPARSLIPIGCFLFCLRFIVDIIDVIKKISLKKSS